MVRQKDIEDLRTETQLSFAKQEKKIAEIKKSCEQKIKGNQKKHEAQVERLEEKHKKDIASLQEIIKELTSKIGKTNSEKAFNEIMDEYLNGKKGNGQ